MHRFVVLEHIGTQTYKPGRHWDLMLEAGGELRTWELSEIPRHGIAVTAILLPNHRLDYLEYEGPVSGDRGAVSRWDTGRYEPLADGPAGLLVRLSGQKLSGLLRLSCGEPHWRAEFQDG